MQSDQDKVKGSGNLKLSLLASQIGASASSRGRLTEAYPYLSLNEISGAAGNGRFMATPINPQPSSGEKALCFKRFNFTCAFSGFDLFVDNTRACIYVGMYHERGAKGKL